MTGRHEEFADYVAGSRVRLLRLACLLAGSVGDGEDLLQGVYEKMYPRWRSLRDGNPDAYARVALSRAAVSRWRQRRREYLTANAPELPVEDPATGRTQDWLSLAEALRALPARQRAVVVLRYYADLSEADVATTLGLPRGTVKSLASRGLTALRTALAQEVGP